MQKHKTPVLQRTAKKSRQVRQDKAQSKADNGSAKANAESSETGIDLVVDRLRKSREISDGMFETFGEKAGRRWAETQAEEIELRRLDRAQDPVLDWSFCESSSAYSAAERFFFVIHPELDGERSDAYEFWEWVTGDREMPEPAYVQGFASGAMEVWDEVGHLV